MDIPGKIVYDTKHRSERNMIYITYTCMILLILFIVLLGYRFTAALAAAKASLRPSGTWSG